MLWYLTVIILNIGTNRCEKTVQTQIRLLLKEQSDQGLHCLPFHRHLLDVLLHNTELQIRGDTEDNLEIIFLIFP